MTATAEAFGLGDPLEEQANSAMPLLVGTSPRFRCETLSITPSGWRGRVYRDITDRARSPQVASGERGRPVTALLQRPKK